MKDALHSFAYSLDFLREQVSDVPAADMTRQPAGAANHPAWTIGHLAFTCQMLAGAVAGTRPWLPEEFAAWYGPGSTPAAEAARYGTKADILARLAESQRRITEAVMGLGATQLDRPFPDPAYVYVFPTIRQAIVQVLVGHTAYHVGQVAVWRRAMGRPAMRRSYE